MCAEPVDGVSIREHIEQIVARIEVSFAEKIGELREDVKHMQSNYIMRSEHDLSIKQLSREIERLDRDQREGFKALDEEQAQAIRELKDDIRSGVNRALGVAGFAVGVFEFIMKFVAK